MLSLEICELLSEKVHPQDRSFSFLSFTVLTIVLRANNCREITPMG